MPDHEGRRAASAPMRGAGAVAAGRATQRAVAARVATTSVKPASPGRPAAARDPTGRVLRELRGALGKGYKLDC